jgi:hypothetical protein
LKIDPAILAHLEWLGFVRPTGLVVSAPALVRASAILNRADTEGQRALVACLGDATYLPDFRAFAQSVLGWSFSPKAYAGTVESPLPEDLVAAGPQSTGAFAVRELEPKDGAPEWQLFVHVLASGEDFDTVVSAGGQVDVTPHGRMERLLRKTRVPAGVLFNGHAIRLLSAPYGESSGWLDFTVADMVTTDGRSIASAMRLLLGEPRLLSLPRAERLTALLDESRKFQNEVSERLAEQVLHALYELLRGFQAAHDRSKGTLLRRPLDEHPDEVYRALLTVILRLVFLLYAEERDMLPEDETFLRHYSLAGLYERLREDAALNPDTMDQRPGGWAQLLVLFRMIHDGAEAGPMRLPRRHGVLFDPDRFPFLEGRPTSGRQIHERIEPPYVPDGTIYRALEKLLVLDGERISYRALDVEQIGSVYETMMGFRLETATGRSVAIKSQKKGGAPTAIDLEALLAEPAAKRDKWIHERADRKLTDTVKKAVAAASSIEDLHAALLPVIDLAATPDIVPKGAMVLQPSEERRRSGSHYTPRSLTEPIVRTTLEPILTRLSSVNFQANQPVPPTPAQILDLKVCDPAMGSGAFLVEACRQLGDALIEAWRVHGGRPEIPPDEDEVVHGRRLVAQRCLYGVDRNPVAVDLAKVSLWLVTLAKDHPLTFVDHALRHGDSLVGLSRMQIEALQWNPTGAVTKGLGIRESVDLVFERRQRIRGAGEEVPDSELRDLWKEAQHELGKVRLIGDLVVAAFFDAEKPREREAKRVQYANAILAGHAELYRETLDERRNGEKPLAPFHWELEFPEVFERKPPGFDVIVGNPPFLGGHKVWPVLGGSYRDFLHELHENSGGKAVDLVAHFFRRAFSHLREGGTLGLVATNTISQGDTRAAGLQHICANGGTIYNAVRRLRWPGMAAVLVSVVHATKGSHQGDVNLDGKRVSRITAFLFHAGSNADPTKLHANSGMSFRGSVLLGMGFTFDNTDNDGVTNSLVTMRQLLERDERNRLIIWPYMGGAELNETPTHSPHRYVINFATMTEVEAQKWPDLFAVVRERVKPERDKLGGYSVAEGRRDKWWQFGTYASALHLNIAPLPRCLVLSRISAQHALAFQPVDRVFADSLIVFPLSSHSGFGLLQSRVHELWARFFGSSLEDRLRYTPSDCFETFPFPKNWEGHPALEATSTAYYEFRAALMLRNNEGLTKTYNRFHDPNENDADIVRLRELHASMDRAVLEAYSWTDVPTACDFFLDYEIDEEEWGTKKKPYRYRWPDEVRDDVLARLLELNAERAAEEARSGAAAQKKGGRKSSAKGGSPTDTKDLFS